MKPSNIVQSDQLKPWKCPFPGCDSEYKLEKSLEIHSLKHLDDPKQQKPFRCEFENCEYRTVQVRHLKHHVLTKHTSKSSRERHFQCPTCPAKFMTKYVLSVHLRGHAAEKAFKCDHCHYTSNQRGTLGLHMKAMHEKSVKFDCPFPECNYSTPWSSGLKRHRRKHESDPAAQRPYSCKFPDCDYRASTQANIDIHVTRHHEPNRTKQVSCPMCAKEFYNEDGMKRHIKAFHAREKNHSCDKCGFKALDSYTIKLHRIAVHKEGPAREKKFRCELCDFRTYKSAPLRNHLMNAHSDERRFKCDYVACYFKTNNSSSFRRHKLIHEKDPERQFPFGCNFPGCDFRRRTKLEIEKHQELHKTSEFLLSCKLCPNIYPDHTSLSFHQCMKHAKTSFTCSVCDFTAPMKCVVGRHYRECHDLSGKPKLSARSSSLAKISARKGRSSSSGGNVIRIVPLENGPSCSGSKLQGRDKPWVAQKHGLQGAPVVLLSKIWLKVV